MDYTDLDKHIFNIPDTDVSEPAKPKRKLTEKQVENLTKGRQKMAEKRALKLNKEASKMAVDDKKTNQKLKKDALKQIDKVEKQHSIMEDDKRKKIDSTRKRINDVKHKYLEKAESPFQYKTIKKMFDDIPQTHYEDETKIKDYLLSHYNSIETAKKNNTKK